jgi:hypothetical protein
LNCFRPISYKKKKFEFFHLSKTPFPY